MIELRRGANDVLHPAYYPYPFLSEALCPSAALNVSNVWRADKAARTFTSLWSFCIWALKSGTEIRKRRCPSCPPLSIALNHCSKRLSSVYLPYRYTHIPHEGKTISMATRLNGSFSDMHVKPQLGTLQSALVHSS